MNILNNLANTGGYDNCNAEELFILSASGSPNFALIHFPLS